MAYASFAPRSRFGVSMEKQHTCLAARFWAPAFCLAFLGGCAHYTPKPVLPERTLQQLQARRLTDPDVLAAVRSATPGVAPGEPLQTWDRAQVLVAALQLNPGLSQARAQLTQATAGVKTARAIQNPTVSLASEYDLSRAGEPTWLYGIGTSFLLDAVVSRRLRTSIAQAGVRGAQADFTDAIWAVRRDVRAALLTVAMARRRAALLEIDARQRTELAQLAHRRVEAGESASPEAGQADLELARARAALEDARRLQVEGLSSLAVATGVSAIAFDGLNLSWDDLDQLATVDDGSLASLRDRALLSRPDLERAIADYDTKELELKHQVGAQYLQTSLGPGYTYDHGVRKATFNASFALPIFNHNEGPIAEAVAAREVAGRHILAVQATVLNEVEGATRAYTAALQALQRTREQRITSESLAQSARLALEADTTDRPTFLAAELTASTERLAELDALDRAQQALGALENALRMPLSGPETRLTPLEKNIATQSESQ
jgi:outer membrane protein TolC